MYLVLYILQLNCMVIEFLLYMISISKEGQ
jgi:hypothetical protein